MIHCTDIQPLKGVIVVDIDGLALLLTFLEFLDFLDDNLTQEIMGFVEQVTGLGVGSGQEIQTREEFQHLGGHHRRALHTFPPREGAIRKLQPTETLKCTIQLIFQ